MAAQTSSLRPHRTSRQMPRDWGTIVQFVFSDNFPSRLENRVDTMDRTLFVPQISATCVKTCEHNVCINYIMYLYGQVLGMFVHMRTHRQTEGQTDGRTDGQMDEGTYLYVSKCPYQHTDTLQCCIAHHHHIVSTFH